MRSVQLFFPLQLYVIPRFGAVCNNLIDIRVARRFVYFIKISNGKSRGMLRIYQACRGKKIRSTTTSAKLNCIFNVVFFPETQSFSRAKKFILHSPRMCFVVSKHLHPPAPSLCREFCYILHMARPI